MATEATPVPLLAGNESMRNDEAEAIFVASPIARRNVLTASLTARMPKRSPVVGAPVTSKRKPSIVIGALAKVCC